MKYLSFVSGLLMISLLSQSQTTWTPGTGLIYYNGGRVGIGIDNPHSDLHIANSSTPAEMRLGVNAGSGGYTALVTGLSAVSNGYGYLQAVKSSGTSYGDIVLNASGGNIGIGTAAPAAKLHIEGDQLVSNTLYLGNINNSMGYGTALNFGQFSNSDPISMARYNTSLDQSELRINLGDDGNDCFVIGHHFHADNSWRPSVSITSSGQMGVNTTYIPADYKLAVDGNIIATKIKVQLRNSWPDYVFHPTYQLPSLKEVEAFVKKNNHLPDVPSAKEVKDNGLDLGDNQALLLKKIEELTLYVIEQNKKLAELEKKVQQLDKRK